MVYNTHDCWVFGLCPSSGILKTQKITTFREVDLSPPCLRTETDPVSETLCSFVFLEYRAMDKVQKPSNPERKYEFVLCFPKPSNRPSESCQSLICTDYIQTQYT
jgi:hypothetical protein